MYTKLVGKSAEKRSFGLPRHVDWGITVKFIAVKLCGLACGPVATCIDLRYEPAGSIKSGSVARVSERFPTF
jgi:hypothetical protein